MTAAGLFTPPSERGTIQVPGRAAAPTGPAPRSIPKPACFMSAPIACPLSSRFTGRSRGKASYDFIGGIRYLSGPRGLPLLKPPFGSIVAIDMNSGEHRWRIPVGNSEAIPAIQKLGLHERLGLPLRSWTLVTKTVMIVVQMGYLGPPRFVPGHDFPIRDLHNLDPHLWVYDKTDGEMLAEIELPANATGAPITYLAGGKQYIAFPVGGGPLVEELIALSL